MNWIGVARRMLAATALVAVRVDRRVGGGTVIAALLPLHDGRRDWAPA